MTTPRKLGDWTLTTSDGATLTKRQEVTQMVYVDDDGDLCTNGRVRLTRSEVMALFDAHDELTRERAAE